MSTQTFLAEQVGQTLAKGIAATVAVCPPDPVRYLAHWLKHALQQEEIEKRRKLEREQKEREREQWNKAKQNKQNDAANEIQRGWKQHLKGEADRKRREAGWLLVITEREQELEDDDNFREENLQIEEFDGQTDKEKEVELERLKAEMLYNKQRTLIGHLDKAAIGDVKKLKKPTPQIQSIMKCCFYMLENRSPPEVQTWMQIRMLIKAAPFLDAVQRFSPSAPSRKRKFVRVRRILKGIAEDEVRKQSIVAHLLHQWLVHAVEAKERKDEDLALKRAEGRDVDEEEEDEEEEPENQPIDPEEEVVRLQEEEEERKRKEEMAEEDAEEGGEGMDEDEDA